MKKPLALLLTALLLLSLLSAMAEAIPDVTAAAEPASDQVIEGEYHIVVTDGQDPVQGAVIQFCDEVTCSFQETDENGVAAFQPEEPKEYEVHVLQVPEGYAEHPELYKTQDTWSNLEIVLDKAN